MQVTSSWLDGMCFVATNEQGHSVVMEGAASEGAVKRGPSRWKCCCLAWPAVPASMW